uniref:Homeobox domain-containing protein n=1 Tax=Timema cristinae TaxID=61476 RepID=A0A7R9CQX1_TIMCR|nr:unnamed protein product [Timema cristinae]
MTSLVLTESSQLKADSFEKLPDHIMFVNVTCERLGRLYPISAATRLLADKPSLSAPGLSLLFADVTRIRATDTSSLGQHHTMLPHDRHGPRFRLGCDILCYTEALGYASLSQAPRGDFMILLALLVGAPPLNPFTRLRFEFFGSLAQHESGALVNYATEAGVELNTTSALANYATEAEDSNSLEYALNVAGKTRTKDKYRVVYSDHQRLELEKEFHYSRYITIRRKAELAATLGLSERQWKLGVLQFRSAYTRAATAPGQCFVPPEQLIVYIQTTELDVLFFLATRLRYWGVLQVKIWFQNRRAKERKQTKKREELLHREKLEVAQAQHLQHAHAQQHMAVVAAGGGGPPPPPPHPVVM